MKNKTIEFFSDPSHGWLKVKRSDIPKDILNKISSFSYEKDDVVYLEEDQDAEIYIQYLKNKGYNLEVDEIINKTGDSFIRKLDHFTLRASEKSDPYYSDIPSAVFDIENSEEMASIWYDTFGY